MVYPYKVTLVPYKV